ncbi:unnamed protein product [Ilex paraguariensis]|uniref:Xylanase inhibitor C-terminal domain-containing protein n=1 Tax=Ilex paraguariensis TaxID=185542 RepID=A0ABC8SX72_9AQUA
MVAAWQEAVNIIRTHVPSLSNVIKNHHAIQKRYETSSTSHVGLFGILCYEHGIEYSNYKEANITRIFPPVALNFAGGASMALKPTNYLVQDGATMWCIGFQKVQDPGITILGGSSSVNVSITSRKDEFINDG